MADIKKPIRCVGPLGKVQTVRIRIDPAHANYGSEPNSNRAVRPCHFRPPSGTAERDGG